MFTANSDESYILTNVVSQNANENGWIRIQFEHKFRSYYTAISSTGSSCTLLEEDAQKFFPQMYVCIVDLSNASKITKVANRINSELYFEDSMGNDVIKVFLLEKAYELVIDSNSTVTNIKVLINLFKSIEIIKNSSIITYSSNDGYKRFDNVEFTHQINGTDVLYNITIPSGQLTTVPENVWLVLSRVTYSLGVQKNILADKVILDTKSDSGTESIYVELDELSDAYINFLQNLPDQPTILTVEGEVTINNHQITTVGTSIQEIQQQNKPSTRPIHLLEYNNILYSPVPYSGEGDHPIWYFDPETDTWSKFTTAGDSVGGDDSSNATLVVYNNTPYIYVFSGNWNNSATNNFGRLNLNTHIWENLTSTIVDGIPRKSGCICQHDKYIYLFGGTGHSEYDMGSYKTDMWRFDLDTDTWEKLSCDFVPSKRIAFSYWVHENKIYIFGGYSYNDNYAGFNDMWYFDTENNAWYNVDIPGVLPGKRGTHAWCYKNNKLYIIGGKNHSYDYLYDFWVYDFALNKWTFIADFTQEFTDEPKWVFAGIVDEHIYFRLGNDGNFKLYKIKIPKNTWMFGCSELTNVPQKIVFNSINSCNCTYENAVSSFDSGNNAITITHMPLLFTEETKRTMQVKWKAYKIADVNYELKARVWY